MIKIFALLNTGTIIFVHNFQTSFALTFVNQENSNYTFTNVEISLDKKMNKFVLSGNFINIYKMPPKL